MKKIWKWLLFVLVILLAAGCVFLGSLTVEYQEKYLQVL